MQRRVAGAGGSGDQLVRVQACLGRLGDGDRGPRRRGRLHRRAEHGSRAAGRSRHAGGERRSVLREARRRHARAGGPGRAGRPDGGRDQRRRLQLPVGSARALRARADRNRRARRDHQLPRTVLLDVRSRPARPELVAVPARPGRLRRHQRPDEPRGRPRAHAAGSDHEAHRHDRDVHPRAARARRRRESLRTRTPRRPAHTGDQRGLRGDAVHVRVGRARHVRDQPDAGRTRKRERLRRLRHARRGRLELRASERAQGLPHHRGPRLGLHHGARRRPVRAPRHLRSRQRQHDRVRGPGHDRGLRVLHRGGGGAAVRAELRAGARFCLRTGGADALERERRLGAGGVADRKSRPPTPTD